MPQTHRLVVDGVALRLLVEPGSPRTLIGWPGTGVPAEAFLALMAAGAARGYTVAALDPPGHGASDPWPRPRWETAHIGSILSAIARHLNEPPLLLVGHSLGGTAVLTAYPHLDPLVRGIVALDGGLPPQDRYTDDAAAIAAVDAWIAAWRFADWEAFWTTAREELRHWDSTVEAGLRAMMTEQHGAVVPRVDGPTIGRMLGWLSRYNPADVPPSAVPTLLLYAAHGKDPSTAAARRQLVGRLSAAQVVWLPDAGHELLWDIPDTVNRVVLDFADGLSWPK